MPIKLRDLLRTLHGSTCVCLRVDATEAELSTVFQLNDDGDPVVMDKFYEYQWPNNPLAKLAADWEVASIGTAPNRITAENEYDLIVRVMSPKFLDQLKEW